MRVAVIATFLALVLAAPAAAHVGVKSYSPKRGATVARTLERVKVTFKAKITDGHLTVRNADGTKVSIGQGKVVGGKRAVRARLKSGLEKGTYTASMSVLHTDGHVMNKSWNFNLSENEHEEDRRRRPLAAAALAVPAAASAHVTLQPREATAGSFSKMDVRVPNERDNKGTIKVDVRLPDGFYFLSYQKVPGWKARVFKEKLDTPVTSTASRSTSSTRASSGGPRSPSATASPRASSRTSRSRSGCRRARRAASSCSARSRPTSAASAWPGPAHRTARRPAPRVTLLAPEPESH